MCKHCANCTRPDSNAILDLIKTNCDKVKECSTLDINISDYLPVYLIRKKVKVTNEKNNFKDLVIRILIRMLLKIC